MGVSCETPDAEPCDGRGPSPAGGSRSLVEGRIWRQPGACSPSVFKSRSGGVTPRELLAPGSAIGATRRSHLPQWAGSNTSAIWQQHVAVGGQRTSWLSGRPVFRRPHALGESSFEGLRRAVVGGTGRPSRSHRWASPGRDRGQAPPHGCHRPEQSPPLRQATSPRPSRVRGFATVDEPHEPLGTPRPDAAAPTAGRARRPAPRRRPRRGDAAHALARGGRPLGFRPTAHPPCAAASRGPRATLLPTGEGAPHPPPSLDQPRPMRHATP